MHRLLKIVPLLASFAVASAAAAEPSATGYAAQHLIPSAMRIEINGLKFACRDKDTQSDCVYRKTRQHLAWMRMADDDCPVQYEAGMIRDIFTDLMSKQPSDAELVIAHEVLISAYDDIKTAYSVAGFSIN